MLALNYKTILSVALPMMVTGFIQSIVLLTDASMIARYSTEAFDAVGNAGLMYVTLFMCLAAVLAYPASLVDKVKGVVLVLPAFIVYSTLRLTIMGLVARFAPAQIELFHVYIMVLVNIGFVLLLWMYWVREVVAIERRQTP